MEDVIRKAERIARDEYRKAMISHDLSHAKRVAIGARWFVKVLGGTEEEKELAYLAGILHDIYRPRTEKVDHSITSANRAGEILEGLGMDKVGIERVVQAVRDHRKPVPWESPLHQSVYLADKILEQMGAYVNFRRCVFVGECNDYKDKPCLESIIHQFSMRLERFTIGKFPKRFWPLVRYQYKWPLEFSESVRKGVPWALEMARRGYEIGARQSKPVDRFILGFVTEDGESRRIKEEAVRYLKGEKFGDFEGLL
jgi:HD superfamily phosphohydrolase YqeK